MVSHFAIPSRQHLGGTNPFVFTEYGVLHLANDLRSEAAIQMSIRIIEIFVRLRAMIVTHQDILKKLEALEVRISEHDEKLKVLFMYLKNLLNPEHPPRVPIGFKSQGHNH